MPETLFKGGVELSVETSALASTLTSAAVDALVGVTSTAASTLKKIGIDTVFDLANAEAFTVATEIAAAAGDSNHPLSRAQRVPGRVGREAALAASRPTRSHRRRPSNSQVSMACSPTRSSVDGLGVASIADLAHWPALRGCPRPCYHGVSVYRPTDDVHRTQGHPLTCSRERRLSDRDLPVRAPLP